MDGQVNRQTGQAGRQVSKQAKCGLALKHCTGIQLRCGEGLAVVYTPRHILLNGLDLMLPRNAQSCEGILVTHAGTGSSAAAGGEGWSE